jgi:hypothetical protein
MTASDDFEETVRQAARQIEATARAAEARLEPFDAKLGHVPTTAPAAIRALVTKSVVAAFIVFVGGVGLFIMFSGDDGKFMILVDMLKTLLLPVVTFVLGHHFGSRSE